MTLYGFSTWNLVTTSGHTRFSSVLSFGHFVHRFFGNLFHAQAFIFIVYFFTYLSSFHLPIVTARPVYWHGSRLLGSGVDVGLLSVVYH